MIAVASSGEAILDPGDDVPAQGVAEVAEFMVEVSTDEIPVMMDEAASMVGSLPLHLISEHAIEHALHLDLDEAQRQHETLHLLISQNHPVDELRFRPERILAAIERTDDAASGHYAGPLALGAVPEQPTRQ